MAIKAVLIGHWTYILGFCIEFGARPNNIFVYIINKKIGRQVIILHLSY